jgi:methanogenic corrinoid protein MtbC1
MSDLTIQVEKLPRVSLDAARRFAELEDELLDAVNAHMTGRADLADLIGMNPVDVMLTNHRNHAAFMANVFHFGSYALLAETLPWVYRTYRNQGFEHAYFSFELAAWMAAIREAMPVDGAEILAVYEWMLSRHEDVIKLSLLPAEDSSSADEQCRPACEEFTIALLAGDVEFCLDMTQRMVRSGPEMVEFFMHVVQPALYSIGARWENGEIGVAQEHLASAIVSRLLASIPVAEFNPDMARGKAVVSASTNEFHEIGAWMVAFCLESDGWDVRYLGANLPGEDILAFVHVEQPDLLCLSVTMAFNLNAVKRIIEGVRGDASLVRTRVLIGGQAVLNNPGLVHDMGADAFAPDCKTAIRVARSLCMQED